MAGFHESVRRDMVQCHLLSCLFSKSFKGALALKGGFAMRAAHGSSRMTKDIDLAASSELPKIFVQNVVRHAVRDLRSTGIVANLEVTEPKQTDTTLRWKIGGYVGGSHLNLTVEVSRRDRLPREHVKEVIFRAPSAYDLPPIVCESFDATALAAAKTACLIDTRREAPRDIFDLFVLIEAEVIPPIELLRKMPREHLAQGLENLWTSVEKMDFKAAATELRPFMSLEAAANFDEELWDDMRLSVGKHVEEWLKQALAGMQAPDLEMESEMVQAAGP